MVTKNLRLDVSAVLDDGPWWEAADVRSQVVALIDVGGIELRGQRRTLRPPTVLDEQVREQEQRPRSREVGPHEFQPSEGAEHTALLPWGRAFARDHAGTSSWPGSVFRRL